MMTTEMFRQWTGQLRRKVSQLALESVWSQEEVDTPKDAPMQDAQETKEAQESRQDARIDARLLERIGMLVLQDPTSSVATAAEKQRAVEEIFNAMRRLDVLEPLMRDPETTEIMVNGPHQVFVERRGRVEPTDVRFDSRERLEELIHHLVARVNRNVNESEPIVDARLPDGSRLNAVLAPVALEGPLLTIRRFPKEPLRMAGLIASGSLTQEAADFLGKLVQARYNLFVCGGTGSGKTTFLNVLSSHIPPAERIITLEDSAELRFQGVQNLARLETRNHNTEGRGEITMQQLIRTSLRMRPDRIIVGEVRGAEAFDMLQAMNTGHDGSMSTGHANSPADMMRRLETMVSMAAAIPLSAIQRQIASALDIVVFLQRLRDHSRRVVEIAEVTGCGEEGVVLVPLFVFEEKADQTGDGRVQGSLVRTPHALQDTSKLHMRGISLQEQANPV